MSRFTPADGAMYLAWRNTFARVTEQTYDWCFRRDDVTDSFGSYVTSEVPYVQPNGDFAYVLLAHERTLESFVAASRYVKALTANYAKARGVALTAPEVVVADDPGAEMTLEGRILTLPAPQTDRHVDPSGHPAVRAQFIAEHWRDTQRGWPIAEHHLVHLLAHHICDSDAHDDRFAGVFEELLDIAGDRKNFTSTLWRNELDLARRSSDAGVEITDRFTGDTYLLREGRAVALSPA